MNNKPEPIELDRIQKLYGLPEFFKQADADGSWSAPASYEEYADHDRRFPVHTQSATYMSCVRAFEEHFSGEKVAAAQDGSDLRETLLKVAAFWGIGEQVEHNVVKKFQAMKVASEADIPDSSFALTTEHPVSGERVRAYPIETSELLGKSAAALVVERQQIPLALRKAASVAILNRATELGVELPSDVSEELLKTAGVGLGDTDAMAEALYKRANVFAERNLMELARETTAVADDVQASDLNPEFCCKVAEVIDNLDADHDLHLRYGFGLDLPEQSCHGVTESAAKRAAAEYFRLPTGTVYRTDDLQKVAHLLPDLCGGVRARMLIDGAFSKTSAAAALSNIALEKVGQVELLFAQHRMERQNVPAVLFSC